MPTIREQAADRYVEHPTASTYYFFLNQGARRSTTRSSARRSTGRSTARRWRARYGGLRWSRAAPCSPPGCPATTSELDTVDCPYGDPREPPDLARARALIAQAGAGGERVTVWGSREADSRAGDRGLLPRR